MKNQENFDSFEKRQSKDPSTEVIHVVGYSKNVLKGNSILKTDWNITSGEKKMEPIKKNHNGNSRTEKINTVYVLSEQKSQSKRVGELIDRSVEIPILNTEGKTERQGPWTYQNV